MPRRRRRRRHLLTRREFLGAAMLAGGAALGTAAFAALSGLPGPGRPVRTPAQETPPPASTGPAPPRREYRAVWVTYLDWARMDFSSEKKFRRDAAALLERCTALGLNTVIAQVRPFGDALYRSALYPWSHICTGTQGRDPGYDPLEVLVEECHARGLSLEAWVNPYRLRLAASLPPALAADNLAFTHPEWVAAVGEGLYLNPAIPEAADYVAQGVVELAERYAVDGIHFDDYFYPTTDFSIDEVQFAASGAGNLGTWRRANVTRLVKLVHDAVKAVDPTLRFGVSPQGNRENNYSQQYCDVDGWLRAEGADAVVDYICPQIYWGYHYTLPNGSRRYAFENLVPEWLKLPRAPEVALYFGLGAWRIGTGDGGSNEDSVSQWCSGWALAQQVEDLRAQGVDGWALYRSGSLWNAERPALAEAECEALAALCRTDLF